MLTRRNFTKLSASAALFAARLTSAAATTRSGLEFGVQLFTVRNEMSNLPATLRLIHSIGYSSVETFPAVYDRPAKELKTLINDSGLTAPSGHFNYATLEEKVDYAAELGLEYMVCPMFPRPLWDSAEGVREGVGHLNKVAAKANAAGLKFGYHPHNWEFRQVGASRGFDVLMQELDPSVRLELDVYWAVEAGQDPMVLMRQNRNRLALIHIKDRKPVAAHSFDPDNPESHHFTEAGTGTVDWAAILKAARRLGVKRYFVDQDGTDLPIAESLRANWKYLAQLSV